MSPTTALSDLQCGMAPLGPPAPIQPPLLGRGVAPPSHWRYLGMGLRLPVATLASGVGLLLLAAALGLGHLPWPLTWGGSSWVPPVASEAGWLLSAVAPDLGHGVAPLGHYCAVAAWHSRLLPLTLDVW